MFRVLLTAFVWDMRHGWCILLQGLCVSAPAWRATHSVCAYVYVRVCGVRGCVCIRVCIRVFVRVYGCVRACACMRVISFCHPCSRQCPSGICATSRSPYPPQLLQQRLDTGLALTGFCIWCNSRAEEFACPHVGHCIKCSDKNMFEFGPMLECVRVWFTALSLLSLSKLENLHVATAKLLGSQAMVWSPPDDVCTCHQVSYVVFSLWMGTMLS